MARERELKLELAPADAGRLAALLAARAMAPARQRSLRAVYFDTDDARLAAAGLSLRLRQDLVDGQGGCIQTIKADAERARAGLFDRREWERPVAGTEPVLAGRDAGTRAVRRALGKGSLHPVFTVTVDRQIWLLRHAGARIEAALDVGTVRAGTRDVALCELELELQSGPAAALFALARAFDVRVPLRPGALSKAQRGHALLAPALASDRAEPLRLARDADADTALRAIVSACLNHYRRNEARLLAGGDGEALHQARVALRRLRSALAIFRPLCGPMPALETGLRALAAVLGRVRDLDVLVARAPAGPLRDRLLAARTAALADAEACLQAPATRALLLDIVEWVSLGPALPPMPAQEFAAAALDRWRRKVGKAGRSLAHGTDEDRHRLRKRTKKLRYAAEFMSGLFADARALVQFRKALEALQDELGALNDLVTAEAVLRALGQDDLPAAAALAGHARRQAHIAAASKAHAALLAAPRFWR
ncbi:MAG: CHAD domain-containing protein [Sandarakinorhabdus sp.]|nr:CHAD domain-containing protein [Sandarakinorhabdus sp.]